MKAEIENKMVELGVEVVDPLAGLDRQLNDPGPCKVFNIYKGCRGFDIFVPNVYYDGLHGMAKYVRHFIGNSNVPPSNILKSVIKGIEASYSSRDGDLAVVGFGYEFGFELAGYFIEPND